MPTTIPSIRYSRDRKAIAPSWMPRAISRIRSPPGSCWRTHRALRAANRSAQAPAISASNMCNMAIRYLPGATQTPPLTARLPQARPPGSGGLPNLPKRMRRLNRVMAVISWVIDSLRTNASDPLALSALAANKHVLARTGNDWAKPCVAEPRFSS